MRDPRLEPEAGEIVILIDRKTSPWRLREHPYDPETHRDGFYTGDVARWIDHVSEEQWRIIKEAEESAVS